MRKWMAYAIAMAAAVTLTGCGGHVVLVTDCDPARSHDESLSPSAAVSQPSVYYLTSSQYTPIGDLASQNSDETDNQIVLSRDARILAFAQIRIDNPGGTAVRGVCRLLISDGTGPSSGLTAMGRSAEWHTVADAAYDLTVPLVGYATKPLGTYNVMVECKELYVTGSTRADLNNLIVWVAAGGTD